MGEIFAHIEGIIGRGGGKIGHNVSHIASGVTDDQNTIRILIIFLAVRERQFCGVHSSVMSPVPLIALTVDGILGVEAEATLKRIAICLVTNWWQTYSRTCGYVKSRTAITLVRATHRCARGFRVPAKKISVQGP